MQGQGWCGHVTQCRARTLSRLLTCTAAAGPGGGAGPSGHFSLDLHSYFKLLDEGCQLIHINIQAVKAAKALDWLSVTKLSLSLCLSSTVLDA